jgi:hypothetical protein
MIEGYQVRNLSSYSESLTGWEVGKMGLPPLVGEHSIEKTKGTLTTVSPSEISRVCRTFTSVYHSRNHTLQVIGFRHSKKDRMIAGLRSLLN